MKIAVLLLNFGEPEKPTPDEVVPFLERIFSLNAPLMGPGATAEEVRARSRQLAEARAPGLIAEYEEIGGSPLAAQAREQGELLEAELRGRGLEARVFLGMQFTDPSIPGAVRAAREWGAERMVALPVYPLAGPSTTVAALGDVAVAMRADDWTAPLYRIAGWHRHPAYTRLRANAVRRTLERGELDLRNPRTCLVFSAHGTPMKYLEEGNGYELYVRDFCAALAAELGTSDYVIGYQNHTNRPGVRWTQPEIERVIEEIDADRVVVDAVSFMHEQSETLAELDRELREEAETRGLEFHRVRIPHAAPEFIRLLADLVEPWAEVSVAAPGEGVTVRGVEMRQCICQPAPGTYCMNPALKESGRWPLAADSSRR